eukprot:scpid105530/ scgid28735/ 
MADRYVYIGWPFAIVDPYGDFDDDFTEDDHEDSSSRHPARLANSLMAFVSILLPLILIRTLLRLLILVPIPLPFSASTLHTHYTLTGYFGASLIITTLVGQMILLAVDMIDAAARPMTIA